MVSVNTVRAANEAHYRGRPLVAVFIGATSGIGEYTIYELTKLYSTSQADSLRIYIVGRNRTSADAIIGTCTKLCSSATFHFVPAQDLALINEIDRVSASILQIEREQHKDVHPRIDVLVMTQGRVVFGPRQDTAEGLDSTMSLIYYSRIRFINNLMPLLLQSKPSASVISVYGAGLEGKLFASDLSLRDVKHYSFANARSHIVYFTTMAFEHLAKQHAGRLSLTHVFPGIVVTPSYVDNDHPWWFKLAWKLAGPIVQSFKAISAEEIGSRVLYLGTKRSSPGLNDTCEASKSIKGTDGTLGSGAYAIGENSEPVAMKSDYAGLRRDGFESTIMQHTEKAFEEIQSGWKFTG